MPRDFLNRKIALCALMGLKNAEPGTVRELADPEHCEYASESNRQSDPTCEIVRRRVAALATCPLDHPAPPAQESPAVDAGALLDGVMWGKTKTPGNNVESMLANVAIDRGPDKLTAIFGKTERGQLHVFYRSGMPYCRSTAAIVKIEHLPGVNISAVCKHCIAAMKEKRHLHQGDLGKVNSNGH